MVSEKMLHRFKEIYFRKYGITLSDQDATEQATAYLTLMCVLLKTSDKDSQEIEVIETPIEENISSPSQLSLL